MLVRDKQDTLLTYKKFMLEAAAEEEEEEEYIIDASTQPKILF
jgi:hypothetical protein